MTEFEGQIKELSKLVYNWKLINVTSKSQLDDFSKKLLNALNKDEKVEELGELLKVSYV